MKETIFTEKKHGEGEEYNEDGYLIFEGNYLYGEKNWKGKEYNEENLLIFEGEYLNGKNMEKEKNIMKMVI